MSKDQKEIEILIYIEKHRRKRSKGGEEESGEQEK